MTRRINITSLKSIIELNDTLDYESVKIVPTIFDGYEIHAYNTKRDTVYVYGVCHSLDDAIHIKPFIKKAQTKTEFSEYIDDLAVCILSSSYAPYSEALDREIRKYKRIRKLTVHLYDQMDETITRTREYMNRNNVFTRLKFAVQTFAMMHGH